MIYDPLTGAATASGASRLRSPTARADLHYRSAVRELQLHPGKPHQLDLAQPARRARAADGGRAITDNYYARDNYESTLHKIDTKLTWTPGNRLNLNNRVSWLTSRQNSHGIFPSLDGAEYNPLSVGRLWQANITSGSVLATSILSPIVRRRRRIRLHAIPQLGRS